MDKIRCWDQFCTLKQTFTKKLDEPKGKEMFFSLFDLPRKKNVQFDFSCLV
jgi:hypothetical protein